MKRRNFLQSLNNAVEGFIHVLKHERNMRVHFLCAFFILLLAVFLGVNRLEWMILCGATCFVLVAEMINTAIEETLDLIHEKFHLTVGIVKNISAGMVLVSALNALIIGVFVFAKYVSWPVEIAVFRLRHAPWYLTFVSVLVAIFFVIWGKTFGRQGTPFRGGLVSGHSAVAFSLWTVVLFTEPNKFLIALTFLLAALVAQSRLRAKIHSFWEVIGGSAIGVLVTALFFQLFK
jgi:diacylglycerol kinase (ATP)